MKKFLITIDTEGDDLWAWKPGDSISTENTLYLPRFQNLANQFGFKPVWLSNYEMLNDNRFVDFVSRVHYDNLGELGMHLHAWNTPPLVSLPEDNRCAPYLIEYQTNVMEDKIAFLTNFIKERTGIIPKSHRAGRWATDNRYFELLSKYGYIVDCSVTPHIDWSNLSGQTNGSKGSDYSQASELPYRINSNLIEIPVTLRKTKKLFIDYTSLVKTAKNIRHATKGQSLWLRPNGNNLKELKWIVKSVYESECDYVMFMIHSSELMPNGSPYFRTEDSIRDLYRNLESLFKYASRFFEGITLTDYANVISI